MREITFEFCALRYLNMWLEDEHRWCAMMSSGSEDQKLDAMSEFAAGYRIARNLPRDCESTSGVKRYKPVLDIIDGLNPDDFHDGNLAVEVYRIERRISREYKRNVVSATTKFLWLKLKSPIIIYDSRACVALEVSKGRLAEYFSQWRHMFERFRSQIEAACRSLIRVRAFAWDAGLATSAYVDDVSSQRWFQERVFDIYLWETGLRAI